MSKLKVTTISDPDNDNTALTIDSSGNVTASQGFVPSTQLSHRNLIINGDMQVAQRATSATTVTGAGVYNTLDKWKLWEATTGNFTTEQSSEAPDGFGSSIKCAVTTAETDLSTDRYACIGQIIEAQNLQPLGYGTSSAKNVTISFWVRSSKTGTYSICLDKDDSTTYHYVKEYTISSANTWEKKTITVEPDSNIQASAGAINNDNGKGFRLFINLAWGSNYAGATDGVWSSNQNHFATSNQVNWMDSTSNDFYLTGVQLEVGSVATPFEHRSYGEELARCQRYYVQSVPGSRSASTQTNEMLFGRGESYISWTYPVLMRTTPTVVTSNDTSTGAGNYTVSGVGNYTNGVVLRNGPNQYAMLTPSTNSSYNTKTGYNADAEL